MRHLPPVACLDLRQWADEYPAGVLGRGRWPGRRVLRGSVRGHVSFTRSGRAMTSSRSSPSARRRSGWQRPARRAGGSARGRWAARRAGSCWWPMILTPLFSGRSMPASPGSPGFAMSTAGVWAGSSIRSGTSGRSASRSGTGRRPETRRPAAHPGASAGHRANALTAGMQIRMVGASKSSQKLAILMAMSVSEQMPLADVKNRLSEVVDRLEREHGRVVITKHGHPAAVVISVEDLESLEETLDVMGSAALLDDIRAALAELSTGDAPALSKDDALRLIADL